MTPQATPLAGQVPFDRTAPIAVPEHLARPIRRTAEIWAVTVATVLLGLALTGHVPQSPDSRTFEAATQLGLLGLATAGAVIAWRWQGVGGAVLVLCGVGLGVLASLQWHPVVAFLVAAAFVLPGAGFVVVWQRSRTWRHLVALLVALGVVMTVGGVSAFRVYAHYFGPAHPQSSLAPLKTDAVEWVWAGGTTPSSFAVTAKLEHDVDLARLLVYSVDRPDLERWTATQTVGDDGLLTFVVRELEPSTTYEYAVETDGTLDHVLRGQVRTFPPSDAPASFTFAFSACARVGSNGQVFEAIADVRPLFYLVTGDLHYGDIVVEDTSAFRAAFEETLRAPAQSALYRSTSVAYMWDDHDYGANDSDRTSPAREAALVSYDRQVPHYPFALTGDDAPVAQAFTVGRVRFLLTDLRSQRSPPGPTDDPDRSMLGAAQREWFRSQLAAAADRYALVVWVSSVPWIDEPKDGADDWAGYAAERRVVADAIADAGVPLLMLGGDAHMLAIDDGSHSGYAGAASGGFPVFQAGALDRPGSLKGGPYSEGAYPGAGQFGVVRVSDTGESLTVMLSGRDWTGRELVTYTFQEP